MNVNQLIKDFTVAIKRKSMNTDCFPVFHRPGNLRNKKYIWKPYQPQDHQTQRLHHPG